MAPIRKRTTARTRVSKASSKDPRGKYAPPSPDTTSGEISVDALSNLKDDYFSSDAFRTSKKDKRIIKHGNLLARVRDGGIRKENAPGKKKRTGRGRGKGSLVADVADGDLADALPDLDGGEGGEGEWEGVSSDGEGGTGMEIEGMRKPRKRKRETKMTMTSLKHRPGAMKKKKILEDREKERFAKNLAQLATAKEGGKDGAGVGSDRWRALRAFIGSTLEKDKAFEGKG